MLKLANVTTHPLLEVIDCSTAVAAGTSALGVGAGAVAGGIWLFASYYSLCLQVCDNS